MRPPPVRIGKYLVEQPLGRGGMGVVLLAFDPTLERRVTIKLLDTQERDAENATAHARTLGRMLVGNKRRPLLRN